VSNYLINVIFKKLAKITELLRLKTEFIVLLPFQLHLITFQAT